MMEIFKMYYLKNKSNDVNELFMNLRWILHHPVKFYKLCKHVRNVGFVSFQYNTMNIVNDIIFQTYDLPTYYSKLCQQ